MASAAGLRWVGMYRTDHNVFRQYGSEARVYILQANMIRFVNQLSKKQHDRLLVGLIFTRC